MRVRADGHAELILSMVGLHDEETRFLRVLQSLDVLHYIHKEHEADLLVLLPKAHTVLIDVLGAGAAKTEAQLQQQLERQRQRGLEAEEYIVKPERAWLLGNQQPGLARLVERIAERDVSAGYDVLSYDIDGTPRYIEVKSSTSRMVNFFITSNEWAFLKTNGVRSWLYFVPQAHRLPDIDQPVVAFPNPMAWIERDGRYQARDWFVEFPGLENYEAAIRSGVAWMPAN